MQEAEKLGLASTHMEYDDATLLTAVAKDQGLSEYEVCGIHSYFIHFLTF